MRIVNDIAIQKQREDHDALSTEVEIFLWKWTGSFLKCSFLMFYGHCDLPVHFM